MYCVCANTIEHEMFAVDMECKQDMKTSRSTAIRLECVEKEWKIHQKATNPSRMVKILPNETLLNDTFAPCASRFRNSQAQHRFPDQTGKKCIVPSEDRCTAVDGQTVWEPRREPEGMLRPHLRGRCSRCRRRRGSGLCSVFHQQ